MGSGSSTVPPTDESLLAGLAVGSRVDATDGNGAWWPSKIVALHTAGPKPHFVQVRCENGYESRVTLSMGADGASPAARGCAARTHRAADPAGATWGATSTVPKIAPLGTHSLRDLADAMAARLDCPPEGDELPRPADSNTSSANTVMPLHSGDFEEDEDTVELTVMSALFKKEAQYFIGARMPGHAGKVKTELSPLTTQPQFKRNTFAFSVPTGKLLPSTDLTVRLGAFIVTPNAEGQRMPPKILGQVDFNIRSMSARLARGETVFEQLDVERSVTDENVGGKNDDTARRRCVGRVSFTLQLVGGGKRYKAAATAAAAVTNGLHVGAKCYCRDDYISKNTLQPAFAWREASVLAVENERIKINYCGWSSEWDAWFKLTSGRVMTVEDYTAFQDVAATKGPAAVPAGLHVGAKCYCRDDYISKSTLQPAFAWRKASVLAVENKRIKVHYCGWSSKWDAWLKLTSGRVMTVEDYTAFPDVADRSAPSASSGARGSGEHKGDTEDAHDDTDGEYSIPHNLRCGICLEVNLEPVARFPGCPHGPQFCMSCVTRFRRSRGLVGGGFPCPLCRIEIPEGTTLHTDAAGRARGAAALSIVQQRRCQSTRWVVV